jgi:hypothetical protein
MPANPKPLVQLKNAGGIKRRWRNQKPLVQSKSAGADLQSVPLSDCRHVQRLLARICNPCLFHLCLLCFTDSKTISR